ncbi:MAG: hypothetical protein ACKVP4_08880 [Hyphomicrobium sp.]
MNIWRGVWRVWIVGSLVWIAVLLWRNDPLCPLSAIGLQIKVGPWCEQRDADYYGNLVTVMLGAPLLVALGLFVAKWIIEGFVNSKNSN